MSAQEQPTQLRSHVGRKFLLGTAALSATTLLLWNALVEQSQIAKDKVTGLAITDTKAISLYFWIAIGSALGGVARYWCSGVAARLVGATSEHSLHASGVRPSLSIKRMSRSRSGLGVVSSFGP